MYFCIVNKKRELYFYRDYFKSFYVEQNAKVKNKILWTLKVIEDVERIPEQYFKHIEGSDGLYEIRIKSGKENFRIFCFFEENNIVVIGHGFQKKSQRTPAKELEKALNIKKEYHEEKSDKS